ncbi:acyl carrier protein [Pseudoalteromonas lipolytica]
MWNLVTKLIFHQALLILGLDSIDVMTIVLKIKRELGIDINDEQLSQLGTVSELIEFLDNK